MFRQVRFLIKHYKKQHLGRKINEENLGTRSKNENSRPDKPTPEKQVDGQTSKKESDKIKEESTEDSREIEYEDQEGSFQNDDDDVQFDPCDLNLSCESEPELNLPILDQDIASPISNDDTHEGDAVRKSKRKITKKRKLYEDSGDGEIPGTAENTTKSCLVVIIITRM